MATMSGGIQIVKKIISRSKILPMLGKFSHNIVILRYHSIKEDPRPYEDLIGEAIIHTVDVFKKQMEILARRYNPISIDDLYLYLKGEKTLPARSVLVTFDDGYADNLELAAPILNQYEIPATIYVTVNAVSDHSIPWFVRLRFAFWHTNVKNWKNPFNGSAFELDCKESRVKAFINSCRSFASLAGEKQTRVVTEVERVLEVDTSSQVKNFILNWQQMKQLIDMGHTIGSHTLSHPNLAYVKEDEVLSELLKSRKILEEKLNVPVYHLSYPNPALQPNWNEKVVQVAKQTGYRTAVTSDPGPVRKGDNALALKRMWVSNDIDEFLWYLNWQFLGRTL